MKARTVIEAICAPFCWRRVIVKGVWAYERNTITKERRAVRVRAGYGPLDCGWVRTGVWTLSGPWPKISHVKPNPGINGRPK